jgi:hypothetical protein
VSTCVTQSSAPARRLMANTLAPVLFELTIHPSPRMTSLPYTVGLTRDWSPDTPV